VAALRAPALAQVRAEDHLTVLRLLARRNLDLGRWRNKVCCRLHALVCELVPGGIGKKIVASQARELLEGLHPHGEAAIERHRLAVELVDDLVHIDGQIRQTKQRISRAVAASATTVTELFGVGDVIAAMIIGLTGDIGRFRSPDAYAAYNATAPVEVSSGGRRVHRLSRRGNRQLNHAIHMNRRHPGPPRHTRPRRLPAQADRKHSRNEAMRALKRRISDTVYRQLVADRGR
jgi:transposase